MPQTLPKSLGDGSRLGRPEMPNWAINRLVALGEGLVGRRLAAALEAIDRHRGEGVDDPQDRVEAREALQALWHQAVFARLSVDPDPGSRAIRAAIASLPATSRASDVLAVCLPFRETLEGDAPARVHLDAAIDYLEAAMAIEASLARPAMSRTRVALHDARDERDARIERVVREAWRGLADKVAAVGPAIDQTVALRAGPAPRTAPSARPAAFRDLPAPPVGAFRVPRINDVWNGILGPAVREVLAGGHVFEFAGASFSLGEGGARYAVRLGRGAETLSVETAFASGNPRSDVSFAIEGKEGRIPVARGEVDRTLHERSGSPASIRLVSELLRTAPDPNRYVVAAIGPYAVRVSPNYGEQDPAWFAGVMERIEAAAEEAGVKVEVGVDGLAARVSDLIGRGYEWADRAGETVMVRKPSPANILSYA